MAVHFIVGGSGAGKSYYLRNTIIDLSLQHKDKTFLVLVPEQFTLETQRAYVTSHPNKGIMNIDVLSFMRLAYRVFEDTGYRPPKSLDDIGKSMIVKKVMLALKDELSLFHANVNKPGFIDEMKSLISEFYQYNIDDEKLEEMYEAADGKQLLRKKLSDVQLVFDAYKKFIEEKYISGEELLGVLARQISETGYIRDKIVCLDGFTGFTPSQYMLIKCLMEQAADIYLALTIDTRIINKNVPEHDLFYLSHSTLQRSRKLAAELDIDEEIIEIEADGSHRNSHSIIHLEKNIFRASTESYGSKPEDISIYAASNINAEVRHIVIEIERLIREEGYRYKDIAILSGTPEAYTSIFMYEFNKIGIPCFVDAKNTIMGNPLIEFIRSLLNIAIEDFSYETVFRFLKCGLMDYDEGSIEYLENYCIATGVRGHKKWTTEWNYGYRSHYKINLEEINSLRERICEQLIPIYTSLHEKHTVREHMVTIYEAMCSFDVEKRLSELSETFSVHKDVNKRAIAKEYDQIFRETIAVMDEIVMLLGDETLEIKEVLSILETGFGDIKVRLIPAGMDQVVIGDIERTRLKEIKALFFTGINDGIIPRVNQGGGILSDFERQFLSECDIELAPTRRQSSYISEYYLYLALTKPERKLYLSYYAIDGEGKSAMPAYLIGVVKNIFPKLEIEYEKEVTEHSPVIDIMGTDRGLSWLLKQLKTPTASVSEVSKALYGYLCSSEEADSSRRICESMEVDIEKLIQALFGQPSHGKLSKAAAQKLYGAVLNGSVTRLERYAACAFSHFLNYGIGLEERTEFKLTAPDIGIIFHEAMKIYGKLIKDNGFTWHDIEPGARDRLALESVSAAVDGYKGGLLEDTNRAAYFIKRIERIVLRTIRTVENQIKQGEFEPEAFEMSFAYQNQMLNLRGQIDRIDTCTKGDKQYYRVIDYKSGTTTFDLAKYYYGLQIQLMVYMDAAKRYINEKGMDAEPAAILYYHMYDPIVEKCEHAENAIMKKLIMDGLVNPEPDILSLTDKELSDETGLRASVKSTVIKASTDKEGRIKNNSNIADKSKLDLLSGHLEDMMNGFADEIISGNVDKNPYTYGKETGCDYCIYDDICKAIGTGMPECRKLRKLKAGEVYELIRDKQELTDSHGIIESE